MEPIFNGQFRKEQIEGILKKGFRLSKTEKKTLNAFSKHMERVSIEAHLERDSRSGFDELFIRVQVVLHNNGCKTARAYNLTFGQGTYQIIEDANAQAAKIVESATQKSKRMIAAANKTATEIIAAAEVNAQRIKEANKIAVRAPLEINTLLQSQPGDIAIKCKNGDVTAHRMVLACFPDSFFNSCLNSSQIVLKKFSRESMQICLDLMYEVYTSIELHFDDLLELYKIVDFLSLTKLKGAILDSIRTYLYVNKNSFCRFERFLQENLLRLPDGMERWNLNPEDIVRVYKRYREEILNSDPVTMNSFAEKLQKKYSLMNDPYSIELFQKAASLGNLEAMLNLANLYKTQEDYTSALEWLIKAAELDCPLAMHNLAYVYSSGMGTAQDPHKAVKWYLKAAQLGYVPSMKNLANIYRFGVGVPVNSQLAEEWMLRATENEFY